ncbi:hypothetical protein ATL39_3092 [Sinobaca qinghaiensis]|uniref:Uncharacterized protein n=1 Tax=Sinobaca qinghaiensis TaxID=342944 RepID=A0A419UX19_9BACL|nr:hypothetical protein [Sinobaca qinghaiensis]RKD69666.1 hypothetical protein ATL39_3092 [Sinobaca qinghaiensis]
MRRSYSMVSIMYHVFLLVAGIIIISSGYSLIEMNLKKHNHEK